MGEGGEGGGAGVGDDGAGGGKGGGEVGVLPTFKWHMTKDSTVLIGSKMKLIFWSSNETDNFCFLTYPIFAK